MSEKLSRNLNLLMAENRLNAEELSRRIDLPASTIKKIRNNNNANPTLSTLSQLANYFSLSISQLIGDERIPQSRIPGSYKIAPEALNYVPLITWQNAIIWPDTDIQPLQIITTEHKYSNNAYALMVEEDNWENLAKDTALLIDPMLEAEHRDFIIVHKWGQKIPSLKQALFDDGEVYLKPIIQGYSITVLTSQHKILGIVVEYKKHLKKHIHITSV
jgi:transcriptional regulator with XRE-family HTH domain